MPITNINRYFVGEPNLVGVVTTDDLAAITTADYFASQADAVDLIQNGQFEWTETDVAIIYYDGGVGFFTYDAITDTFVATVSPGDVQLPVVDGNFANFIGTSGKVGDLGYLPSDASLTNISMVDGAATVNDLAVFSDVNGTITSSATQLSNIVTKIAGNQMGTSGTLFYYKLAGTVSAGAVTIDAQAGVITTESLTTAAGASYTFTLTSPGIALANSVLLLTLRDGTNTNPYVTLKVQSISGSNAVIAVTNVGPSAALNGTVFINFLTI